MGTIKPNWKPSWWNDEHMSAWDRIKEAMRRDWEQTKKDLHVGGHELNQEVKDTVKQAAGKEQIPAMENANPPKVIGNWDDVELPIRYGYGARSQYGSQHPTWNDKVETQLRGEWEASKDNMGHGWDDVRPYVRRGYEHRH